MIEEVNAHVLSLVDLERLYPQKAWTEDPVTSLGAAGRQKNFDEVRDELKTTAFLTAAAGGSLGAAFDPYDRRDQRKCSMPSMAGSRGHGSHINLSEYEQDVYSRLTPYFDGALPLHEVAWRERLAEEDIFRLLKKSPDVLVYQV